MYATSAKQHLNDRINIRHNGYTLSGTVTRVTEKAIEITTSNTHGEFKPFTAKVWFPKKAIVDVPAHKDSHTQALLESLGQWKYTVSLANWFRLDDRQIRLFQSADTD